LFEGLTLEAAAALIDPSWAVALVQSMPDDADLRIRSPRNAARLDVANVLGRTGDGQFMRIRYSFLSLRVPDTEDTDPYD
jgi:hypothetical protein